MTRGIKIGTGTVPCNGMQTILRPESSCSLVLEPIPRYSAVLRDSTLFTRNYLNRDFGGSAQRETDAAFFGRGTPRFPTPRDPVSSCNVDERSRPSQIMAYLSQASMHEVKSEHGRQVALLDDVACPMKR